MYIRTDDDHNIIELIIVGVMPEKNGYEVNEIDEDIMRDILNYKYINGEFVKSGTSIRDKYINEIRNLKINNMSQMCQMLIKRGIDYNGLHYSLDTTDQINLMKLESMARFSPEMSILYHADGEDCRVYSANEILEIAALGTGLITYHTTYFNQLKSQINDMTSVDEVIGVKYGMTLDETHDSQFKLLTNGLPFTMEEIIDDYDYESIIPNVDDVIIDNVLNHPETTTPPVEEENPASPTEEPWKPNTNAYIPEDESEGITDEETDIESPV